MANLPEKVVVNLASWYFLVVVQQYQGHLDPPFFLNFNEIKHILNILCLLLAGASAGVYALIAAHVSTLIMNWKEDGAVFKGRTEDHKLVSKSLDPTIRTARITFVVTFTLFDIIYALYNHYSGTKTNTG